MRQVQVVPKQGFRLFAAMVAKEAELSRKNKGTFRRRARGKTRAKWIHIRYKGWITLARRTGEVLQIKVRSKEEGGDWQLLHAILGFLDRHFGRKIRSITIQYGE